MIDENGVSVVGNKIDKNAEKRIRQEFKKIYDQAEKCLGPRKENYPIKLEFGGGPVTEFKCGSFLIHLPDYCQNPDDGNFGGMLAHEIVHTLTNGVARGLPVTHLEEGLATLFAGKAMKYLLADEKYIKASSLAKKLIDGNKTILSKIRETGKDFSEFTKDDLLELGVESELAKEITGVFYL